MGIFDSVRSGAFAEISIKERFSNRLSMLVKDFEIQKKELANEIGVSAVTITKYTNGVTMPSFEALSNLAAYFNVTVDYLLGRTEEPFLREDSVYFAPIGRIPYSFKISDSEELSGELEYIFGLTVWNMELPRDETALHQFLCFKFSSEANNQRLYDCLFLTDELNVGYFLYTMSKMLGLPFMDEYQGPLSKRSQYLANLLVWNENGIKAPKDVVELQKNNYLATLAIPTANERVRLDYTLTCGAEPHLQAWLKMRENERRTLLMRRLRRIKTNFR
ncbi:helix-turn-helix domain-containing protein [Veillonella magna]|uniref:helix-turn-helix domain-containing protein n=1 Tax=Veillonella magna TaxID=464322 RepID=UPI001EF74438|nr:helix-turn-helix transcriptional regulator [Veillonella magna]